MSGGATELDLRIEAGEAAVRARIPFFRDRFGRVGSEWKEDDSRVTEADRRISDEILGDLREAFPGDDLCSEETPFAEAGADLRAEYAWVLDPIDGTNNFALGIPHCAISLALLREGMPVYGWIYEFPADLIVHGGSGRGVFADDRRLESGGRETGKPVPVGVQFPLEAKHLEKLAPLLRERRVRSMGSSALEGLYVALGLFEGAVDWRVKVWDVAAVFALFPETGTEARFLREPAFPLRRFHPSMPPAPYLAGSPAFIQRVEKLLAGD